MRSNCERSPVSEHSLLSAIQEVYGIKRGEAEREVRAFEERNKNYRPK
jgi:hypothetical protein